MSVDSLVSSQIDSNFFYDSCLLEKEENEAEAAWEKFRRWGSDFTTALSKRPVDFSLRDQVKTWQEQVKEVVVYFSKIVIFPWGLSTFARYAMQRIVMMLLYPAQSRFVRYFVEPSFLSLKKLEILRQQAADRLCSVGFLVRHVVLEKNGTRYSGLLVGHKETISNGRWAIQATGRRNPIEYTAASVAQLYRKFNFNTLLINGPGVGLSEGEAGPFSKGAAQEVGISFLENAVRANQIVLAGHSLGGAAIGQAILQHEFKPHITYVVIRQMTFDSVSNVCGEFVGELIPRIKGLIKTVISWIVKWSGCEMDSVAASRKLQQLGIKEVIIQSGCQEQTIEEIVPADENDFFTDGVIHAKASLGFRLMKESIIENKVFLYLKGAGHRAVEAALVAARNELQFFESTAELSFGMGSAVVTLDSDS